MLADERAEKTKLLDEVAHERMELHKLQHEEKERATMKLQKLQSTYQMSLSHYNDHEAATAKLIKQLKNDRQAAEDKSKLGLERISCIVQAWRNRTKSLIEESSVQWWSK